MAIQIRKKTKFYLGKIYPIHKNKAIALKQNSRDQIHIWESAAP